MNISLKTKAAVWLAASLMSGAAQANDVTALLNSGTQVNLQAPALSVPAFQLESQKPRPHLLGVRGENAAGETVQAFFSHEQLLSASLYTRSGRYDWHGTTADGHWAAYRADAAVLRPEQTELDTLLLPNISASAPASKTSSPGPDGLYIVDIFAVVTPRVLERLEHRSAVIDEIERQLFLANSYFANSGVLARYNLLDVQVYSGTQEDADAKRNLAIVANDPAIAQWRDALGADLVVYFRTPDGDAGLAISAGFNGEDKNDPPQDVNPERDAFAVVYAGTDETGTLHPRDFITPHELGHNLGAGHNWNAHKQDGFYWQTDAHGFDCGYNSGTGPYASIMSYGFQTSLGGGLGIVVSVTGDTYGDFFSSPEVFRDDLPCGLAKNAGPEATQADNVRVINAAVPYVAAYRERAMNPSETRTTPNTVRAAGGQLQAPLLLLLCLAAWLNFPDKDRALREKLGTSRA